MRGRAFLDQARDVVSGRTEAHWRGAVVHAYYGLLHECHRALLAWGVALLPRQPLHSAVRLKFVFARHPELKDIGKALEDLSQARNKASYDLNPLRMFAIDAEARKLIQQAADALALLDAIEADPRPQRRGCGGAAALTVERK
jgi:hypothetical protein